MQRQKTVTLTVTKNVHLVIFPRKYWVILTITSKSPGETKAEHRITPVTALSLCLQCSNLVPAF